jgi:pSer/pThr/pTyr-binding forkhead associated (FHA) protein
MAAREAQAVQGQTLAVASPQAGSSPPPRVVSRPPAPDVNFAPRAEPAVAVSAPPTDTVACPLCGSSNQRGLRFCVTCGHLLTPVSAQPQPQPRPAAAMDLSRTVVDDRAPVHVADAPPPPAPPAGAVSPGPPPQHAVMPIAPVRVVDVGAPTATPMQRLCPRCRGASEANAQFCRLCGAPLTDAPTAAPPAPALSGSSVPQPSPNPIAAASPLAATALAPPPVVSRVPAPGPAVASAAPAMSAVSAVPVPAAAPAAVRARLVLIARDGGEGPNYPLGDSTDVGRVEGNIVVAEDRYISPRHARIQLRAGAFYLRDLSSANGVYLRIPFVRSADPSDAPSSADSEQLLQDQDLFLVGQQVLRFEVVKQAEEGFGVASENGTLLFGTPAAPRYARLSQRTVEGVVRDVYHLRKAETVIGRESGDIVFTDDPFLSRRHAVLRVHGTGQPTRRFTLADLGSSNGSFLQVREEVRLRHGDHFRIGQQLFRFDLDATPGVRAPARAGA